MDGHGRRFAELPAISCCLPKLCPILSVAVSKRPVSVIFLVFKTPFWTGGYEIAREANCEEVREIEALWHLRTGTVAHLAR